MKKLLCKLNLHSFKLTIKFDNDYFPHAYCKWCDADQTHVFGPPPVEVLYARERLLNTISKAKKLEGLK
jgi:hypothetical protein